MGKITTLLKQVKALCNIHDGEDTFLEPVSIEKITEWESENHATLCDELMITCWEKENDKLFI